MSKIKVTCLECGESDVHTIDDSTHTITYSEKVVKTPLLGVRWRPDEKLGFRCKCGNYNLLAPEEADKLDIYVDGDSKTVEKIKESLSIPDNKQFKTEII